MVFMILIQEKILMQKKFDELSYDEVLQKGLKVADATAISLCRDNELPIVVFNLLEDGNIAKAVSGKTIGTIIKGA